MPEGYRAYMTDNRDGHVYSVAKIGDKLWMTRNLSYLGIASIDNLDASIYSDSSNVSSNTFFSWTKSTQESTAKPYFYPSNQSTTTNNKDFVAIPTERGNWYNYAGATANTIIGVSNSNNATYDICPKGWRLPTKSEFETLASSNRMDLFIPMDGFFYDITLISTQGTYYWSATSNSATSRYMLKYTNDITQGASVSVITQTRYDLRYVRCIFGG